MEPEALREDAELLLSPTYVLTAACVEPLQVLILGWAAGEGP